MIISLLRNNSHYRHSIGTPK